MPAETVALRGRYVRKEGVAGGAVLPGHLVQGFSTVTVHSAAGGNARRAFALENDLVGRGVNDAYAVGETVQYGVFEAGAEVYAVLATGQNVAAGDALESAGDGTLRKHNPVVNTAGSSVAVPRECIVGYATEAKTTTTSTARIRVEVA